MSPRPSPFHRASPPGLCWVCNRHIGPTLSCTYCDADQPYRSNRIGFRLLALSLALAGVAFLLVAARRHPVPPAIPVARLNPHSPFTLVRIEGRCVRPSTRTQNTPINRLQDESGTIRILLDRAIGPQPNSLPRNLRPGQSIAILGSAALDSKGQKVFYGLKWAPLSPQYPP